MDEHLKIYKKIVFYIIFSLYLKSNFIYLKM